jgi:hypothetical protein
LAAQLAAVGGATVLFGAVVLFGAAAVVEDGAAAVGVDALSPVMDSNQRPTPELLFLGAPSLTSAPHPLVGAAAAVLVEDGLGAAAGGGVGVAVAVGLGVASPPKLGSHRVQILSLDGDWLLELTSTESPVAAPAPPSSEISLRTVAALDALRARASSASP